MNRAAHRYRRVSITTSDPKQLVVMLFDGFLKFAHRALASLKRDDKLDATRAIGRALDILHELTGSLDHTPAPQLSSTLEALYVYVGDRMLRASLHQDHEALDEVIALMSELREGFQGALIKVRSQSAAA